MWQAANLMRSMIHDQLYLNCGDISLPRRRRRRRKQTANTTRINQISFIVSRTRTSTATTTATPNDIAKCFQNDWTMHCNAHRWMMHVRALVLCCFAFAGLAFCIRTKCARTANSTTHKWSVKIRRRKNRIVRVAINQTEQQTNRPIANREDTTR